MQILQMDHYMSSLILKTEFRYEDSCKFQFLLRSFGLTLKILSLKELELRLWLGYTRGPFL